MACRGREGRREGGREGGREGERGRGRGRDGGREAGRERGREGRREEWKQRGMEEGRREGMKEQFGISFECITNVSTYCCCLHINTYNITHKMRYSIFGYTSVIWPILSSDSQ